MKKPKLLNRKNLNNNLVVFVLFIVLFIIQWFLVESFQSLDIIFAASLIYLPHGLRVLATLIGGSKILPGLFLGHIISGFFIYYENLNFILIEMINTIKLDDILIIILASLASTYCVILSMYILNFNLKKIENISLKMILIISIISSIINSFFTNSIYYINNKEWQFTEQFFYYIAGDLFGACIIFYCLKFLNNYLEYNYRNND